MMTPDFSQLMMQQAVAGGVQQANPMQNYMAMAAAAAIAGRFVDIRSFKG